MNITQHTVRHFTRMKIAGSGFGDCSQVVFSLGPEHSCLVGNTTTDCTDTEVECTVTKNPTMHTVRNTGRHIR